MPNYAPGYLGIDPRRYEDGLYREPFAEASNMFSGRRESQNVVDQRNASQAMQEMFARYQDGMTGRDEFDMYGDGAMPVPVQDNRHTRAIDNLVQRLQGYAPSRQTLMAPNMMSVPNMEKYYTPEMAGETERLAMDALRRRMMEGMNPDFGWLR